MKGTLLLDRRMMHDMRPKTWEFVFCVRMRNAMCVIPTNCFFFLLCLLFCSLLVYWLLQLETATDTSEKKILTPMWLFWQLTWLVLNRHLSCFKVDIFFTKSRRAHANICNLYIDVPMRWCFLLERNNFSHFHNFFDFYFIYCLFVFADLQYSSRYSAS